MTVEGWLCLVLHIVVLHTYSVHVQTYTATMRDISSANSTNVMNSTGVFTEPTTKYSDITTSYKTTTAEDNKGLSTSSTEPTGYAGKTTVPSTVANERHTPTATVTEEVSIIRPNSTMTEWERELPLRGMSDEERLLKHLLDKYNPSARPVMRGSDTVNVEMQFSLMHIKDLDIKSQVFTTTGLLILEWSDERLTWEPRDHNNLNEIIVEIAVLWKPEFAVINGAEDIYEEYNQFRAVVSHKGVVHWEPGGVFKTMCEIDITYYPFDDQQCKLTFGAWTYHTAKMNMSNMNDTVNTDSYSENGEWTIISSHVKRDEFFYQKAPNEFFAFVDFSIYLRRRHLFYVLNVILPSIMTSVLLLSVFFCTPAQKVQIGVVVLLSFRIFLLNVADNIPKTSDHIPLLGIYLTCTMAITTLSMVLTVLVLNLHHISDRPVPGWARSVLFIGIARIMGMCNTADALAQKRKSKSKERQYQQQQQQTYMNSIYHRPSPRKDPADCLEEKAAMMLDSHATKGHSTMESSAEGSPSALHRHTAGTASGLSHEAYLRKLHLQREEEKIKEKERLEDYANDWRKIAEIFDRLFFWLFLFAIVLSTLALFHPLIKKQPINFND